MSRTAVVENSTDDVLVLDTSLKPDGVDCRVQEVSDQEAAKFDTPGAYKLSVDGVVTIIPPPLDPADALKAQIVALAQSAVGVLLNDLTPAQRNALIVCMLYKLGGVTSDMKVRPLGQWVRPI